MKNLTLTLICIFSIFSVTAQDDSNLYINELAIDISNEYNYNSGPHLKRKDGDNDLQVVGILAFIFSDDTSKYKYGNINPRINMLLVHNLQDRPELPFYKWIEDNVNIETYSDSTRYRILYEGFGYGSEDLRIYDLSTGECIRWICIWYDNFNESNEYQNLGSISDNIYE